MSQSADQTPQFSPLVKISSLADLVTFIAADPPNAARELDAMGDTLKRLAANIREQMCQDNGLPKAPGGMSDRVLAKVIGPNGDIKQQVDSYLCN